jgi:hypothetical protein
MGPRSRLVLRSLDTEAIELLKDLGGWAATLLVEIPGERRLGGRRPRPGVRVKDRPHGADEGEL